MKNIIAILLIITMSSCGSRKKNYDSKKTEYKIANINSGYKKIDLRRLYKMKDELQRTGQKDIAISKKGVTNYFYKSYDGYVYDEYNIEKVKIKETKIKADSTVDVIENINTFFDSYESYYGNGNMKSKNITSWFGFVVGTSYKYDEKGNITETKDWDKGYTFTFDDVLKFLLSKKVHISKPTMVTISKITNNDKIKTWVITYPDNIIKKKVIFVLSALDGSVMINSETELPTFRHSED